MEFVELRRFLQDTEVDCVVEVGWLATLVRDVSKVLEDLGMPPTSGIPQDPRMADNVLEVVDVILECLWESYTSGHGPGIMHCSLIIVVSVVLSVLAFCFVFALFC
jgi:hypothetical protein